MGWTDATADQAVHLGPYKGKDDHERVIEVPIEVSSGEVVIGGPEEYANKHIVKMPTRHYRLAAAQIFADPLPASNGTASRPVGGLRALPRADDAPTEHAPYPAWSRSNELMDRFCAGACGPILDGIDSGDGVSFVTHPRRRDDSRGRAPHTRARRR